MDRDRVLIEMWERGEPVRAIGRIVGRNPGWVSVRAAKLGLAPRSPRITTAEKSKWCDRYRDGDAIVTIAREFSRDPATVRKALVADGLTIIGAAARARKWPVRHEAFRAPLSAEAWYWIGFLAADGNVHATTVTLGLEPKCAATLHRFLSFLGCPERPLAVTARGRQLTATVHSAAIAGDIGRHGVVPRKTLGLRISREAAVEPAFWLGFLDGDGSVTISRSGVPAIYLVGTRAVMDDAAAFIGAVATDRPPSVHRQIDERRALGGAHLGPFGEGAGSVPAGLP